MCGAGCVLSTSVGKRDWIIIVLLTMFLIGFLLWVSQLSSVLGLGALLSLQFLTYCALVEDVLDVIVHARPDVLSLLASSLSRHNSLHPGNSMAGKDINLNIPTLQ